MVLVARKLVSSTLAFLSSIWRYFTNKLLSFLYIYIYIWNFREPFEKSKNNIYKRNCKTCNFIYIGETSQHQQNRDRGHKDAIKAKDVNNSFYDHLHKNPSHEIDWEKVSYLDKERNYDRRMIKESLYIRAFDEGNLMNLKNPRPVNSVWNEFQSAIRKSTRI